jgi:hypothetical protein
LTGKFQVEMKGRNKEKLNTILYCEQVLLSAETLAEKESISLIDAFQKLRKKQFRMLQQQDANYNFGAFKREMMGEIDKLEDALMNVELKLQESLQISTTDFQDRVKKIIDDMKVKTQAYIKEVNEIMELFSQDLKVYALAEYDRINSMEEDLSGGDAEQMSDDMIHLMSDSDALNQHLEASKENIDSRVNDVESNI